MNKSKCYWETLEPWKFLWWSGVNKDSGYNHEWGYIDREHRKCKKCGTKEFRYDVYAEYSDLGGRYLIEDWREVYK